ncbi:YjiH family protein [Mycoplasma sp. P36-A1]|uniref:YjiH family protein n=1 Tax=Mycoplasma sp. P36-A1 TaxID=3252900 RepID=UPI003C2F2225
MSKNLKLFQAVVLSFIGIIIFFVEVNIGGKTQIPLEHLIKFIQGNFIDICKIYTLIIIIIGALLPFIKQTYNKSTISLVFSILSLLAIPFAAMYFFNFGPEFITNPDTLPYFFDKLALPVSLYIPIGSVFLSFILSYGLLEFVGVLVRPFIRPIFKTPGKSAIDAVASFVGSYALGLLITSRLYQVGKYTAKEASIIATGFSTVSVTFMIIVKDTAELGDHWLTFFWSTLFITFFTTFVVVRIRPLKTIPNEYYEKQKGKPEIEYKGNIFKHALLEAKETALNAPSFVSSMTTNFKEAIKMALVVIPSLLSVGTIGVIVANNTPIFDILGYIFYPFFYLISPNEAVLAGKAVAVGFVEMFLPVTLLSSVANVSLQIRFIIAVTSISTILFLSGTMPCILGTKIPIKFSHMIIIYIERAIITIICSFILFQALSFFNVFG